MKEDWYWAAKTDGPAHNGFVIANGENKLWTRVRAEIDPVERCAWMPIHRGHPCPRLDDILDMMFTVVPTYRVSHNRFVLEAVAIPAFAEFLRNSRADLCNYISNSAYPDELIPLEHYDEKVVQHLEDILGGRA